MTMKDVEMASGVANSGATAEPEISLQADPNEIVAYGTPMGQEDYKATPTMAPVPVQQPPPMTTITMSQSPADVPLHLQQPQGSMCCGCCCDFRRAVIILDSVLLAIAVISMIGLIAGTAVDNLNLDDDDILEIVEDSYKIEAILTGISILCYIIAIVGAYQFNVYMLGVNIVWEVIGYIVGIVIAVGAYDDLDEEYEGDEEIVVPVFSFAVGAVIVAILIYPHAGLIYEIKKGIMSHETYVREERSCCCVTRRY